MLSFKLLGSCNCQPQGISCTSGIFCPVKCTVWVQVVLGQALHQVDELLPSSSLPFDDIAAAILLVFFGVRTLQVSSMLPSFNNNHGSNARLCQSKWYSSCT